jgi:probable H4MPT-linked C1 transfer pathway protein
MTWLGLDIGGANLKVSDGCGWARTIPFALWREPSNLPAALVSLLNVAPAFDHVAVTMTGELCDCFRTKTDGVLNILNAVERAASGPQIRIYLVDGRLVSLDEARRSPELTAASNWHALARFAARLMGGGAGILIDIGSTTTDIIPLSNGEPHGQAFNDTDRLLAGQLVYSGIGRTPICALTHWLPWHGRRCPVAAELFATTADAYVLTGDLPEQPHSTATADGRPLTKEFARERLARMICADRTTFSDEDAQVAASHVRDAHTEQLGHAARRAAAKLPHAPQSLVVSGSGEFLATKVGQAAWPNSKICRLSQLVGPGASQCGPAHALAVLARDVTTNDGVKNHREKLDKPS